MRRRRREAQEQLSHGADALRWFDGGALFERLAEQQARLVADALARAGRAEAVSQENARLARDLAGSLDRIQEVHHRVRNHLQALTGLLSAQELSERSLTARRALQQSALRLSSVAAIHDLLARDPRSGELKLPELAAQLTAHLLRQAGAEQRVRVRVQVAPITLAPREATAFVLILTELLSNAIEHGFAGGGKGVISLRVTQKRGQAVLEVRDNGRGLPADFDLGQSESLGLRLVARLAERDLGGAAAAWNAKGACFRVTFPVPDVGKEA